MALTNLYQLLLRGLEGTADPNTLHYLSPEAAYEELKKLTGQDFGFEIEKWQAYIRVNQERLGVVTLERRP